MAVLKGIATMHSSRISVVRLVETNHAPAVVQHSALAQRNHSKYSYFLSKI